MQQVYDDPDHPKLRFYGRNEIWEEDFPIRPYCYIEGEGKIKDAITEGTLKKLEFDMPSEVGQYRYDHSGQKIWEADIPFERRVMLDMDWKIDDVPKCWFDIETDDSYGAPDSTRDRIVSIGMIFDDGRKEWLHGNEKTMLADFHNLTKNIGVLISFYGGEDVWETRSFDVPYIATRFGGVLREHEITDANVKFQFDKEMKHCAFMDIYKIYKYETSRVGKSIAGGYGLDNVASQELGRGKVVRTKKIIEMEEDELKEYNMRDVEILKELDEKFSFTDSKIRLAQLTNLNLCGWRKNKKTNELRPLIMVDQLILQEGKKLGIAWPVRNYDENAKSIVGALVLEPRVGLHNGVQNYDVKQMYPNIMINEKLSPDKHRVVIPNILGRLKKIREELKVRYEQTKSKEDFLTQYGYKVLSNVFYGAVGNPACRVFDRDMAQAVTMKGQRILGSVKQMCEELGFNVVYGDTDSVFVLVDKDKSKKLLNIINNHIKPYEIEDGEYYRAILFLGDIVKGKIIGTKKRYVGIEDNGSMKTVGVEAVRRDYCQYAREIQLQVLGKILNGVKVEQIKLCVANAGRMLKTGDYDEYLVISKGVKSLDKYNFGKTTTGKEHRGLPHVRALKMAVAKGYQNMFEINFVYTKNDVAPVLNDVLPSNIDYDKYYESQVVAVTEPLIKSLMVQDGSWKQLRGTRKKKILPQIGQDTLLQHMSS